MTPAIPKRRFAPRPLVDSGFTLVELLVVVGVIGVLAAIGIPAYLGVQQRAMDTAVESDLVNARIALQNYVTANPGSWPALSATDGTVNARALQPFGWVGSGVLDASAPAGGSASSYCIRETSASGPGSVFYLTESIAPTTAKPAGCA